MLHMYSTFDFLGFYGKSSRTEEEILHLEQPHHLQARDFLTSSPNGVRTCSDTAAEDQLIRSQ